MSKNFFKNVFKKRKDSSKTHVFKKHFCHFKEIVFKWSICFEKKNVFFVIPKGAEYLPKRKKRKKKKKKEMFSKINVLYHVGVLF